jgi:predicted MFS family arabinose efflux permease
MTGKVFWRFMMSLDGFVAGPSHGIDWMSGISVRPGVHVEYIETTGAVLGGRDGWDAWSDARPYGGVWKGPIFVLTHHPEDATPADGVTFLSCGPAEAVRIALEAASRSASTASAKATPPQPSTYGTGPPQRRRPRPKACRDNRATAVGCASTRNAPAADRKIGRLPTMHTYRELFRAPEFTPLFVASCAHVASTTLNGLALATLVYARTDSPLLAALSMFGPSFAELVGATTLLSVADRVRPRAALTLIALAGGVAGLVLATPGMPLWVMFVVILALGLVNSIGGGVRYGLLNEIVPPNGYVLGRSVLNISVGAMQIAGFALGGILLVVVSPRATLTISAALAFGAALVLRWGLSSRPARASGRPSIAATWRVNRHLLSTPARRAVYLSMWVPNGLVVGCEALFVPYAPQSAAALFVAVALGMLLGDLAAGRFLSPDARRRLVTPLRFLLALPYLLFALPLSTPIAAVAVAVAAIGFASTLMLQERLIALIGEDVRGQALGLHGAGMKGMQAVGATLAGLTAQYLPAGAAMTVMAVASLAVTAALSPGLRLSNGRLHPDRGRPAKRAQLTQR